MADALADAGDIEKLYGYGERLNEAKDKSKNVEDYRGIIAAAKGSQKEKQLAAQLIPRFLKYFPSLAHDAINTHFDLCEEEELGIRVQAIRGMPLLCKDTPEDVPKIVDVLGQLLTAEENVERDAVNKSLMSLLRQDPKASLTALFKHVENNNVSTTDENIRKQVLNFIKDKVFPLKSELLKPQVEMERHITDLVKKSLQDVTGQEFIMFVDFLKTLSIFGESAPRERVQELTDIIEEQADLNEKFDISNVDHIDRLVTCLHMALPFFKRGASNSKSLNFLNTHILPAIDKFPEERKLEFLKILAESTPPTAPQDSRQLLPAVVLLLKKYMPRRKTGEETNFTYIECLLYALHHLASKTPNATNSLCGYHIVTGQPSDRLGEDFSDIYKDFQERLVTADDLVKVAMKKLSQHMPEHDKAISTAKTEEEKTEAKVKKLKTASGLRTCNNILTMTPPLRSKAPTFIGDDKIALSWKPAPTKSGSSTTVAAGKRTAPTANASNKRGRGSGVQSPFVNQTLKGVIQGGGGRGLGGQGGGGEGGVKSQFASRALKGLFRGGRGGGRGRGQGGRWRGRGRGYQ